MQVTRKDFDLCTFITIVDLRLHQTRPPFTKSKYPVLIQIYSSRAQQMTLCQPICIRTLRVICQPSNHVIIPSALRVSFLKVHTEQQTILIHETASSRRLIDRETRVLYPVSWWQLIHRYQTRSFTWIMLDTPCKEEIKNIAKKKSRQYRSKY